MWRKNEQKIQAKRKPIDTKETGQEPLQPNMAERQSSPKRMPQYDTTRATRTQEDWEDGWNRHSKAKAHTYSIHLWLPTKSVKDSTTIHSLPATL
jgi:hypothetical protein